MDPRPALLAEVSRLIGILATPSLRNSSNASDLFEGYVFGIVLQAASDLGAVIDYADVAGLKPPEFVCRTSPGHIYSRERNYCHALLQFRNRPALEAHLGVRVQGASGVLHECDIAILTAAEAATCRSDQVEPRQSKVIIAVECKFYSVSLPLDMARGFVGLVDDLPPKRGRILVFNTSSDTAERYLTARDRLWEHQIHPGAPGTVQRLRATFQLAFRNYIARP